MSSPNLTCVVYHHLSATPDPFVRHLGITTSPDNLLKHISYYQRHYNIIDVDTALSDELPPKPLLLTFDDSFRSTLTLAAPILKANDIPAVVFLNPQMVTAKAVCLDNLLSYFAAVKGAEALAAFVRRASGSRISVGQCISEHVSRMSLQERGDLKHRILAFLDCEEAELWEQSGLYLKPVDVKQFRAFGMEVGNHTGSHIHCRNLSKTEMSKEITESKAELEDLSLTKVRTFAFPYGNKRDATTDVLSAIREAGHDMTFLVHARSNAKRPASDIWYRVSLTNEPKYRLLPKLQVLPGIRSRVYGTA